MAPRLDARRGGSFEETLRAQATQRGSLLVRVRVSFPRSFTALQARVLRQVGLRYEELEFIHLLQSLYAFQYASTVPDDSPELVYAPRCFSDAVSACVPDPLYWSWWRRTV